LVVLELKNPKKKMLIFLDYWAMGSSNFLFGNFGFYFYFLSFWFGSFENNGYGMICKEVPRL